MEATSLRGLLLLLHLTGILCTLQSKPQHAMVGVGSSAKFTCQSTVPNSISWHFKPVGGSSLSLNDTLILPSGANVSISFASDQKTSTVILHGVTKRDLGTIACADNRETSFADLTVLDTEPSGGLTLCPTDVVATSGESVLMRAAGKPDSLLRWYRSLYGSSVNSTIFTGDRMDYKQVDERYFVAGSREEEKTLNILNVTSADAGQFTVRDEFSRQAACVNVVVIEADSVQCQIKTASEVEVHFFCQVKFTGYIKPMIQWLMKDKVEPINGALHATDDGTLQSRLTVPAADSASWPTKCLITFPRQSCNQPRPAFNRTPECPADNGLRQSDVKEFVTRHPVIIFIVAAVISLLLVIVLILALVVQKLRKRKLVPGLREDSESHDADSPANSDETDETASEHDPYDTVVVYQNHSPPPDILLAVDYGDYKDSSAKRKSTVSVDTPRNYIGQNAEYEKLRRPVVQPRSRHPRNGSVVSETNLYEEPIVT